MSKVRQLIERLDEAGTFQRFAKASERYGDDLEQSWAESEDGGGLLWLAAEVGVDPKRIFAAECDLLEAVVKQVEIVGQETISILEAVRAWEKGEQSAHEVQRLGAEVYELIESPDENDLGVPWMDDVTNAAVWLTNCAEGGEPFPEGEWEFVDRLAHALTLHGGWGIDTDPPDGYQRSYDAAMRRFASIVRGQITGVQVKVAAQQSGVWPL